ncbi:jhy protein homolog, partial [Megalops cyprinoides]|uniref:jhy protein homolog n=1 Tax=Megalops cyprinoides TaxID=118141 RepID=UPI0018645107
AEKEAHLSLWDSLESDTESLAQERLYQMQLQSRIHQGNRMEEEDAEGDSEEELGEQDNYIYDSLDVTALRLGKRKPTPDNDGVQEVLQEEKSQDTLRNTQVEDEYASLRYDPNWRSNLKGAQHFGGGRTQLLLEEDIYHDAGEASGEGPWQQIEFTGSGAQENAYARGHVPAVSFVAGVEDHGGPKLKPPPTPYRPPLQGNPLGQAGSPASAHPRRQEQLDRAEGVESDRSLRALSGARNQAYTGENHVSHELEESYENMNERYAREYQVFYDQESARTNEAMNCRQDGVHYKLKHSHRLSNARPVKPKDDIVERNKMTLGVQRKQGSYLRAHGQRGEKEHINQEPEAMEEISSISSQGSQDNLLDPELRWQQKTQRLKVYHQKKRQRREGKHLKPIVKKQNPSGSGTVVGGQSGTRSHPLRLGHAEVLVIDGADPGSTAADVTPFLSPGHQQASITLSPTQRPPLGPSLTVYNPTPLSCYHDRQHQEGQRLSHRQPSQSPGSYKVLPPIGQTVASDTELSSQSPRQQINPIQRSSSEGYLAQLVRQKQLKEKTTYKAYSLKDYKALKQDVKLGGLGPNYEVTEMTAEKIRRQKQYSNKVREQNKNLSRNLFLPAKNPMGSDTREDIVPRRKALEYARSIPKPRPPPQPKNREAGKEDFHEPLGYLEDIDLSQLARLEMLQKRHEEEKQVVAHFKALRVI